METVVVAFAGEQNGRRVKEILESAGAASCLLCRSADQVRRLVSQQRITTVVCGYKFPDGTAEELAEDLYDTCNVLVVASQGLLDLIQNEALFRLPAPATRRELVVSVVAVFILFAIGGVLGWICAKLLPLSPGDRTAAWLSVFFMNNVFIGFPVVEALFGQNAVFCAALCSMKSILLKLILPSIRSWATR